MRQKEWLSDLELGMSLVKRTREGLQALCLEEGKAAPVKKTSSA